MKLIRPSYEILEQGPGIQGVYEMIERCGKTSYKSDFKGGEFAKRFVETRTKEKHGAVLEFGTVYLFASIGEGAENAVEVLELEHFYESNSFSKCIYRFTDERDEYYITTNYRVLVENNRLDDLKYQCEPTEFHKKRYAVKFNTDIGVGREFLRHRVMSMVQESTRYVNYTKEKFGDECTFVIPSWITKEEVPEGDNIVFWDGDWCDIHNMKILREWNHDDPIDTWLFSLVSAERDYQVLINKGWLPQQARTVLPLSTKTEFVLCGFEDAWRHFFRLRSDMAATGKPHPQAQELANPLREEFIEKGYITRESLEHEAFGQFDVVISDSDLK